MLSFDEQMLKRFDAGVDNGVTDDHILAITRALRLRPVPVKEQDTVTR